MWDKVNFNMKYSWFLIQFSFSLTGYLTKAKEISLPYYLPIAGGGGRTNKFMSSLQILARSEHASASSRIWTLVTDYISDDDKRYAKRASIALDNPLILDQCYLERRSPFP